MDIFIFLARFWGLMLVGLCGSLLVNRKLYGELLADMRDKGMVFIFSMLSLIVGAATVAMSNSWTWDAHGLVTLLGWGALLKGFIGAAFPKVMIGTVEKAKINQRAVNIFSIIFIILGIYLLMLK
ncbi:MAG: hypothetical protein WCO55_03650 [Candidatus Falkowbacteria bacterium]